MTIHLDPSMPMMSSIAEASAPAGGIEDKYGEIQPFGDTSSISRTERLHGSLGLYLVLLAVVLILVIGSAILLWRIHRRHRAGHVSFNRDRHSQDHSADRTYTLDLQLPTVSYRPDGITPMNPGVGQDSGTPLKLPALQRAHSLLRYKFAFFTMNVGHRDVGGGRRRGSISNGSTPPHSSGAPPTPTPVVPSIVISECSPVICAIPPPALQSSPLSSASVSGGTLHVPGSEIHKPMPLVTVNSPSKKSFASRRAAPEKSGGKGKGVVRSPIRRGKENVPPSKFKGRVHDMSQETRTCVPIDFCYRRSIFFIVLCLPAGETRDL